MPHAFAGAYDGYDYYDYGENYHNGYNDEKDTHVCNCYGYAHNCRCEYNCECEKCDYIGIMPVLGIPVTFDPNGGDTILGHASRFTVTGGENAGTVTPGNMPMAPTRLGFTFIGWSRVDGNHPQHALAAQRFTGDTIVNPPGITVYAIWGFAVTFHGGGGSINLAGNQGQAASHSPRFIPVGFNIVQTPGAVMPNNPERIGYTFIEWRIENDPARPFTQSTPVTEPLEVVAAWEPRPHHLVSFINEGGMLSSGHTPYRWAVYGMNISVSSQAPLNLNDSTLWPRSAPEVLFPGRTLEGWWTESGGWNTADNDRWAPAGEFNISTTATIAPPGGFATRIVTEGTQVFAHWVYRITFHPNEGMFDPTAAQTIYSEGFPNPGIGFQPATGLFVPGAPNQNHFRDITVFDGTGTVDDDGYLYNRISNTAIHLGMPNEAHMVRAGHIFAGWWNMEINPANYPTLSTQPAGAVQFDGATPIDASATWYARWIPNPPARITFRSNANDDLSLVWRWQGYPAGVPVDQYERYIYIPVGAFVGNNLNVGTAGVQMPFYLTRDGYMFTGWFFSYDADALSTDRFVAGTTTAPGTLVFEPIYLYARWLPYMTVIACVNGSDNFPVTVAPAFDRYRNFPIGLSFNQMHAIWTDSQPGRSRPVDSTPNRYNLAWMQNQTAGGLTGTVVRRTIPDWAYHTLATPNPWNRTPSGPGPVFTGDTRITAGMFSNGFFSIYLRWVVPLRFVDNIDSFLEVVDPLGLGNRYMGNLVSHRTQVMIGNSFSNDPQHPQRPNFALNTSPRFPRPGGLSNVPALNNQQHALEPLTREMYGEPVFVFGWNTGQNPYPDITEVDPDGWFFDHTIVEEFKTLYGIWSMTIGFDPGFAPDSTIPITPFNMRIPETDFFPGQELGDEHFNWLFNQLADASLPCLTDENAWPGFRFAGWFSEMSTDIPGGFAIDETVTLSMPRVIFATWLADFLFNANGGIVQGGIVWETSMAPFLPGRELNTFVNNATIHNATRTNWEFAHWNTNQFGLINNTGTIYSAGTPVSGHRNLYAQWQTNIRFGMGAYDGNSRHDHILAIPEGSSIDNRAGVNMPPNPTRLGYSFVRWEVLVNGAPQEFTGATSIVDGLELMTYSVDGGANIRTFINVRAIWDEILYPLTIDNYPNDVTPNPPNSQTPSGGVFSYNSSITLAPGSAPGWEFLGWYQVQQGETFVPPTVPETGYIPGLLPANYSFYIPRHDVKFVAIWRILPTPPTGGGGGGGGLQPQPPQELPEDETPSYDYLTEHHAYIIGFEDGTVRPRAELTRAQVATILFRLMTDDSRAHYWAQQNPFPDVLLTNWHNNAVSTTFNADIFVGMPDGTFMPNRAITRAELAATIVRFMNLSPYNGAPQFNDIAGHWAQGYISASAHNGWVMGDDGIGGQFRPDSTITRAEATALINRAFGRLPEYPEDLLEGMRIWPDNANPNTWYYLHIQEATNSHTYMMKADGIHETWVELISPERLWALLERPTSTPWDILQGP